MTDDEQDDPFLAALQSAPIDDEPFTDEDCAAAEAGWSEYRRGEASPLEDVRRRILSGSEADKRAAV